MNVLINVYKELANNNINLNMVVKDRETTFAHVSFYTLSGVELTSFVIHFDDWKQNYNKRWESLLKYLRETIMNIERLNSDEQYALRAMHYSDKILLLVDNPSQTLIRTHKLKWEL